MVAVRVTGLRAGVREGCYQERLPRNTGIIVDMGVISFPQCSRALRGRTLEGVEVLTGSRRSTQDVISSQAVKVFGLGVFSNLYVTWRRKKLSLIVSYCL